MGRVKVGPQGSYWDPNDDGPNQADASTIGQAQMQAPQQSAQPQQGIMPPNAQGTPFLPNVGQGPMSQIYQKQGPMSPNTGVTGMGGNIAQMGAANGTMPGMNQSSMTMGWPGPFSMMFAGQPPAPPPPQKQLFGFSGIHR